MRKLKKMVFFNHCALIKILHEERFEVLEKGKILLPVLDFLITKIRKDDEFSEYEAGFKDMALCRKNFERITPEITDRLLYYYTDRRAHMTNWLTALGQRRLTAIIADSRFESAFIANNIEVRYLK